MGVRRGVRRNMGLAKIKVAALTTVLGGLLVGAPMVWKSPVVNAARAQAAYLLSWKMAQTWKVIATNCDVGTTVAQNPMLRSGPHDVAQLLWLGESELEPRYRACYAQSGVKPIPALVVRYRAAPASDARYLMGLFPFSLDGGGGAPFTVYLYQVPEGVVRELANAHAGQISYARDAVGAETYTVAIYLPL